MLDFDNIYAKSDGKTTLELHTRAVVEAGFRLLKSLPLSADERSKYSSKIHRMAVLHDLGKVHRFFQQNLLENKKFSIRHELFSFWLGYRFLKLETDELFAIVTHHKGIQGIYKNGKEDKGRFDKASHFKVFSQLYEHDKDSISYPVLEQWLQLNNICIAYKDTFEDIIEIPKQWQQILSVKKQMQALPDIEQRKQCSVSRALLMAADHIGSAEKENVIPKPKLIKIADFQPKKGGEFLPFRDFQKQMLTVQKSCILHSPTGSGKTEAALAWVYANQQHNARLFYLLPYTASSNAMIDRLVKVYNEHLVTPLHSKTMDYFYDNIDDEADNYTKQQLAKAKSNLSREIFFPVKVATMHQILKNTLKGKGWEFALLEYRNALFIFDEFHTYNAFYTGLMLASVKLLINEFNAKVMFMSATIPYFMMQLIVDNIFDGDKTAIYKPSYESASDKIILERKRHQLFCINARLDDNMDLILRYINNHSVLIIVNNVKTAQDIYERKEFDGVEDKCLLHSGLHANDRREIEKRITHEDVSQRPRLLIATQAVEVSLDIDYDVAFIENAPIDALIQRFGRVNRAGKKSVKPWNMADGQQGTVPVYLFKDIIGKVPFYDKDIMSSTWNELLHLNTQTLSEDDLVKVCNKVYINGYSNQQWEDFEHGFHNDTINQFSKKWLAGDWSRWTDGLFENNQKVDMICDNLVADYEALIEQRNYIEANRLLVQIYPHYLSNKRSYKSDGNLWLGYEYEYISGVGYKKKEVDVFL